MLADAHGAIVSNDKKYNGWVNYETWCAKLWMDNDEGSYRHWGEIAQECYDAAEAGESYASQTREDAAAYTLSERLKDEHEEGTPTVTGVYADLLNAALSEVNWYEIAQSLLEDVDKDANEPESETTDV
jgi:hypothetical protein